MSVAIAGLGRPLAVSVAAIATMAVSMTTVSVAAIADSSFLLRVSSFLHYFFSDSSVILASSISAMPTTPTTNSPSSPFLRASDSFRLIFSWPSRSILPMEAPVTSSTKETFLDLLPAEVIMSTNDTRRDLLPDGTDRFRRMSSVDAAGGDTLPLTRMLGGRLAVLFLLAFCTLPPPPELLLNMAEEEEASVRGRL